MSKKQQNANTSMERVDAGDVCGGSFGWLDLRNKQSIVDLMFAVHNGEISPRRAATEIQKHVPNRQLTKEKEMGKATMTFKEIRFTGLDTELMHCFVLIQAGGDCPLGVQGWHHKAFSPSISVVDIVSKLGSDDPALWPLCAPGNE